MTLAADDKHLPRPPVAVQTAVERRDRMFGWLISSPSLGLLFLVILFPVFWALFTSVHDYTLIAPNFDTFNGIDNYVRAAGDPEFRHTLWLTAFFAS
jgi:multiple sugar transport system permease protein